MKGGERNLSRVSTAILIVLRVVGIPISAVLVACIGVFISCWLGSRLYSEQPRTPFLEFLASRNGRAASMGVILWLTVSIAVPSIFYLSCIRARPKRITSSSVVRWLVKVSIVYGFGLLLFMTMKDMRG